MFPNWFDLSTLVLRVSHGTDDNGKTLWEKWWFKLFCLKLAIPSISGRFYDESRWWYTLLVRKWPLPDTIARDGNPLNNNICGRLRDVLSSTHFKEGIAAQLSWQTVSIYQLLQGLPQLQRATLPKVMPFPRQPLPDDWTWQGNKGLLMWTLWCAISTLCWLIEVCQACNATQLLPCPILLPAPFLSQVLSHNKHLMS